MTLEVFDSKAPNLGALKQAMVNGGSLCSCCGGHLFFENVARQAQGRLYQKGLAFVPDWKGDPPADFVLEGYKRTSVVVEFPDGDTLLINETHRP